MVRWKVERFLCGAGLSLISDRLSEVEFLKLHKLGTSQKKDLLLSWEGKRGNSKEVQKVTRVV